MSAADFYRDVNPVYLGFPFCLSDPNCLVDRTAALGKVLVRLWSTVFRRRRTEAVSRLAGTQRPEISFFQSISQTLLPPTRRNQNVAVMGITEVVTAPRSPWQNAHVERVIGSIRRECLDHVVIFNERHLRHVLSSYVDYYHRARTNLSLDKDCPHSRPIQPHRSGRIIAIPQVGGLHHRYQRLAA